MTQLNAGGEPKDCPYGVFSEDPATGEKRPATAEEAAEWANVNVVRGTLTSDHPSIRCARGEITAAEMSEEFRLARERPPVDPLVLARARGYRECARYLRTRDAENGSALSKIAFEAHADELDARAGVLERGEEL